MCTLVEYQQPPLPIAGVPEASEIPIETTAQILERELHLEWAKRDAVGVS